MPIQTDTSVSPYFDDFDELKDYYKTLFKPGVPVQVRELNQLQTVFQKQIERLGDNLYKRGTIIDGCDITFHDYFPYVKLLDSENNGAPVNVAQYQDYYVRNSANLQAVVVKTSPGFESTAPDLNTLFVRYLNSGTDANTSSFAADESLTVFNANNVIEKITITNASAGFSNTDSVFVVSQIAVQNTTGGQTVGFSNGDIIDNGAGANVTIIGLDTASNTQVTYLKVKPLAVDLNVNVANTSKWSFAASDTVSNSGTTATVVETVGSGAAAAIVTGSAGEVDTVSVTSEGSGYFVLPHVTVASSTANTGQITTLDLSPQTFLTTITVAGSGTAPVGSGYATTIGEGLVYQKGYFTRVDKQLIVVSKYSAAPDSLALGFNTQENVINSNIDTSLLDNAVGSPNATAPGADRLKLVPTGTVLSSANAEVDPEFLTLVEFSAGLPYKQNVKTRFNILGDEIARRTFEESGNYVLDTFSLSTLSSNTLNATQNTFSIVVDPGLAYINGKRVETLRNYTANIDKGIDTATTAGVTVSMDYGSFVRVKEFAGGFDFAIGDYIKLYDTAQTYLTTGVDSTISMTGNQIGTARLRSLTLESGTPGSPNAIYRVYLFDIQMSVGKNFRDAKSIFYDNGTYDGVGDMVLEADPTTGNNVAILKDTNRSGLVFSTGISAIKGANTIAYTYRNYKNTEQLASNGTITFSTGANEVFPYSGTLSSTQVSDIIMSPVSTATGTTNLTGTITASGNTITGSGTSFTTELVVGDYIKSGSDAPLRVTSIANTTSLSVHAATSTASSSTYKLSFPKNIPIDLSRSGRSAVVAANTTSMTIDIANVISGATTVNLSYNIRANDVSPATKQVQRDHYVRVYPNTHSDGAVGPWCMGSPDLFRLKGVYKGSTSSFAPGDAGVTDVTNDYYIDLNHTEDYVGLAYLYRKQDAVSSLSTSGDYLLVEFDMFVTSAEGLKAKTSYPISDNTALASATSTVHTLEIPEFYGVGGNYYDLRDSFDIRPIAANTVVANTTPADAPLNPSESSVLTRFSGTNKKFPAPDSTVSATLEYYRGRIDRVIIDEEGTIATIKGIPGSDVPPDQPSDSLTINLLEVPPYPSLPLALSSELLAITDTKVANEKYLNKRIADYRVGVPLNAGEKARLQPRGYTMEDIGDLERRISDLEYYVSYTLAEALVRNRPLPSSVDPSIDRFKFGFFVDPFDNYAYSDINNPKYSAYVNAGFLCPADTRRNLQFYPNPDHAPTQSLVTGSTVQFSYNQSTLFSQLLVTSLETDEPVQPPDTFVYNGTFTSFVPPTWSPGVSPSIHSTRYDPRGPRGLNTRGTDWSYSTVSQNIDFTVVGLKPNTKHKFFFEGEDNTERAMQDGYTLYPQTDLVSDSNGEIRFSYFYYVWYSDNPQVQLDTATLQATPYIERALDMAAVMSSKSVRVADEANTSFAEGVIEPRSYIPTQPEVTPGGGGGGARVGGVTGFDDGAGLVAR